MNQLFKAIVFQVAYETIGGISVFGTPAEQRAAFVGYHTVMLLKDSGLPTDGSFRPLTSDLLVKALRIRVDGYFASLQAPRNEYVLVYADPMTEVGSSFSVIKTRYKQRKAAEAGAVNLTRRCQSPVKAITLAEFYAARRGVIRRNMMADRATAEERANGYTGWYVEALGTPAYMSPSCEAYWQM